MKNSIIIKNTSTKDVEKSVKDMANLYAETEFVKSIEVYRSSDTQNSFMIKFPNLPDFERFSYFVNFLEFPINFQNYNPTVFGIYELQEKINKTNFEIGETVALYISKKDEEHDNVYVINSKNNAYKYTFYNKVFKTDEIEYKYEDILNSIGKIEFHKEIFPSEEVVAKLNKPWWKFW